MIHYLKNNEINFKKWDACIEKAHNGLIYGYSFYLTSMAKNWDGIVVNDYEAVMPVVWNKKYLIRYLYQPPFLQQCGIFSTIKLPNELLNDIITTLKTKFKFAEIFVNIPTEKPVPNFVLSLSKKYEELKDFYTKDLCRNLKVSAKKNLSYSRLFNYGEAAAIYRKLYGHKLPNVKQRDYSNFLKVCDELKKREMLFTRNVYSVNNKIMASGIFLKDERRIYNIMSSVTIEGRKISANHFLFDELIKEFANQNLLLDFEGSLIPGIKKFYEGFGAKNESYYFLRFNLLPQPVKWLKNSNT